MFNFLPLRLFLLALSSMIIIWSPTTATPLESPDLIRARDVASLSQSLGIQVPDFTNEAAVWATTFTKNDTAGNKYSVQLPRVYTAGHYDAASTEQLFVSRFSSSSSSPSSSSSSSSLPFSSSSNAWLSSAVPHDMVLERHRRAFAAYLKLRYCNKGHGSGTCTPFELNYNSGGCQAAPGTNSIVVEYSANGAVVAWNKGGCSGRHTLFANGCNSGSENVDDETPGTNSFQFIVGCTF